METVAIDKIKFASKYLRTNTNVEKLKKSIQTVGLLNPLVINENFELLAGARRYTALKELGINDVPVNIVSKNALEQELISIDENLVRQDLTKVEVEEYLSRGKQIYEQLYPNATKTEDDIDAEIKIDMPDEERSFIDITAEKTGLSKKSIKSAIDRDQKSSQRVKKLRASGDLNASQANELIKLDHAQQEEIADLVIDKSAKDIKKLVSTIKETNDVSMAVEEVINAPTLAKEYQSIQTLSKRMNKVIAKVILEEMTSEHEETGRVLSSLTALRHNIDQLIMLNTLSSNIAVSDKDKFFSEENLALGPEYVTKVKDQSEKRVN